MFGGVCADRFNEILRLSNVLHGFIKLAVVGWKGICFLQVTCGIKEDLGDYSGCSYTVPDTIYVPRPENSSQLQYCRELQYLYLNKFASIGLANSLHLRHKFLLSHVEDGIEVGHVAVHAIAEFRNC